MITKKRAGYAGWVQTAFAGVTVLASAGAFADTPATDPMTCCDPEPSTQPSTQPALIKSGTGTLAFSSTGPNDATTINGSTVMYAMAPSAITVSVNNALIALHDIDRTLSSFTADARQVETDPRLTSGDQIRVGTFYYQKTAGQTNIAFHVTHYLVPDGVPGLKKDEIDGFVPPFAFIRDATAKRFDRYEVVKPDQKVNPLKIGSGYPPLPIGQDPSALIKEFEITELPAGEQNTLTKDIKATDVTILRFVPRPDKTYEFQSVVLYVDKKLSLPIVMQQVKRDGNIWTLALDHIESNKLEASKAAEIFAAAPPHDAGWKVDLHADAPSTQPDKNRSSK